MIYLVTREQRLFDSDYYEVITVEESLALMEDWKRVQYDSETSGRDAHICKLLCMQFGNDAADIMFRRLNSGLQIHFQGIIKVIRGNPQMTLEILQRRFEAFLI